MAAFVTHLKAEIDDVFLANLEIVRDSLAAGGFTPAGFVQSKLWYRLRQ